MTAGAWGFHGIGRWAGEVCGGDAASVVGGTGSVLPCFVSRETVDWCDDPGWAASSHGVCLLLDASPVYDSECRVGEPGTDAETIADHGFLMRDGWAGLAIKSSSWVGPDLLWIMVPSRGLETTTMSSANVSSGCGALVDWPWPLTECNTKRGAGSRGYR